MSTLPLLRCLCTSVVSAVVSGRTNPEPCLWSKVESYSSVSQGLLQMCESSISFGLFASVPPSLSWRQRAANLPPTWAWNTSASGHIGCESSSWSTWFSASTWCLQARGHVRCQCRHLQYLLCWCWTWSAQDKICVDVNVPIRGMPGYCPGQLVGVESIGKGDLLALCEL